MDTAPTTTTAPADNIPVAPAEKPSDLSQLERQLNQKPKLPPRTDFKNLSDLPDSAASVPAPVGVDVVPEKSVQDFLAQMENKKNTGPISDEPEQKTAPESTKEENFDFSDLDLSKDPEPVVEEKPKGKKTKEDNFAELRKKAEAAEFELKTRDEKLAEYQQKLEEMEATLERTAFEKSPKFREKFQAPYEAAVNDAVEFAKTYTEDPSIAEKAMSLQGRERIDFIDEHMSGAAASAFLSKIEAADSARNNLESALADHRATNQQFQQDDIKQQEKVMQTINTTFDRVLGHLATKSEYFRKGDDTEHNSIVEKRVEAARNIILGNAPENEMAVAPFLAVIAKDAVAENAKLKAELAKYKARVSKDNSVQPSVKRGTNESPEKDSYGKPKGAMESIRSYFR
jgi:hypothetical protein